MPKDTGDKGSRTSAKGPGACRREERIAKAIVAAAYAVHRALGPGLLENVYEVCFCHELTKRGLSFRRQVVVPIVYDGIAFDEGLRLDVLVEELVICELKAVETMHPVFLAQLLTQRCPEPFDKPLVLWPRDKGLRTALVEGLKLTGKRLGFLINFNVPLIKRGIKRVVL